MRNGVARVTGFNSGKLDRAVDAAKSILEGKVVLDKMLGSVACGVVRFNGAPCLMKYGTVEFRRAGERVNG